MLSLTDQVTKSLKTVTMGSAIYLVGITCHPIGRIGRMSGNMSRVLVGKVGCQPLFLLLFLGDPQASLALPAFMRKVETVSA
jgi:hypothetical protein